MANCIAIRERGGGGASASPRNRLESRRQARGSSRLLEQALALEMVNITKTFPGVRALDDVTFACARGEVHALCGENGAGKSTLIKILGGAYRPDGGRILLGGREVGFSHPVASRASSISIIHQQLSLLPPLTVAENI